jgi:hypothetical protein
MAPLASPAWPQSIPATTAARYLSIRDMILDFIGMIFDFSPLLLPQGRFSSLSFRMEGIEDEENRREKEEKEKNTRS